MRRLLLLASFLLLAGMFLVPDASHVPVQAAPLRLDEGENRQCPAGKPYYVTGIVEHHKRDATLRSPSVRFHVRLANETVLPHVVIDEALSGSNGRFKLCFGDGDVPPPGQTREVRAFSVFTPQTSPVIRVRRSDGTSSDFVEAYYSAIKSTGLPVPNSDIGSVTPVQGSDVERGFRLKDDFQAGYDRVSGATGPVEALFPSDPITSRFCQPAEAGCVSGRIYLEGVDGERFPFIVLHEMGHSVMFHRYNGVLPTPGCTQPHGFGVQNSQACVWAEDWASFWAMAIRDNPVATGVEFIFDLDMPPSWPSGDNTEGRVAGALWDMYDLNPESMGDGVLHPDFYMGGLTPIWNLLTTPLDNTFSAYWTRWKNNTSNDRCASTSVQHNTINYSTGDDQWTKCDAEAWWRFQEGSGTTVSDSVDAHPGAFVGGGAWASGIRDNAGNFNGQNYVSVPAHANLNTSGSFSISLWVWPQVLDGVSFRGVMYKDFEQWGPTTTAWRLLVTPQRKVRFDARADQHIVESNTPLDVGTWAHIAAVYDQTAGKMQLYLNGVLENEIFGDPNNALNLPVVIGKEEWSSFIGLIDEVRMYRRALARPQVRALATEKLEANWRFHGGTEAGFVVEDSTGFEHTGSWVNGSVWSSGIAGLSSDKYAGDFFGQGPFWNSVTFGAHSGFNTPSFSLSLWLWPKAIRLQGIIYKDFDIWGPDTTSWRLLMNLNGTVQFDARANQYVLVSSSLLTAGQWTHIAATYDNANGVMKLYINGILQPALAGVADINSSPNFNLPVVIGKEEWTYLDGIVDLVRFYTRALSAAEVKVLSQPWCPAVNEPPGDSCTY